MRVVCAQDEEAALGIMGEWMADIIWRELNEIYTV